MDDIIYKAIGTLFTLALGAYGWIFNRITKRLEMLENRQPCKYQDARERIDKLEGRFDKFEPHLIDIKVKLARIEEALLHLDNEK